MSTTTYDRTKPSDKPPPRRSIDLRCESFLECCQSLSTQTTSRFVGLIPTVSSPGVGRSGTLSGCLKNELVGLEEVDNDRWRVFFGTILLGVLDVRRTHELRNARNFGLLVRADGVMPGKRRRRRPYRR